MGLEREEWVASLLSPNDLKKIFSAFNSLNAEDLIPCISVECCYISFVN